MTRRLNGSLNHRIGRRATLWIGRRPRPRPPNYLGLALRAWRRVIRVRRRLMKLAPEKYDVAVVKRLARERAEDEKIQAEMRAAIARVYGVPETDLPPRTYQDPFSWKRSARTRRAIAQAEAEREYWLEAGALAYEQFQSLRPQPWVSLNQIASLLDVASRLGRLATGLETFDREPRERAEPQISFREALARVYGQDAASIGQTVQTDQGVK